MYNFENYLKINVGSEKTVSYYLGKLNLFFNEYREFNQDNVNEYFQSIIDKKGSGSLFNQTRNAFAHYIKHKKLDIELPKSRQLNTKIKDTLTAYEIENELFGYFPMLFSDPEKRQLVFKFTMLTMMRISEVVKLKPENINFKTREVQILDSKRGKNRVIILHKDLIDDIRKECDKNRDTVFGITEGYIEYIFKQINDMLGYKKRLTPHSLRHAGAKLYYQETNHDIRGLQVILGHKSLETTQQYLGVEIDDIRKSMDMVNYKKASKKDKKGKKK